MPKKQIDEFLADDCAGNISEAARRLEIDRVTFVRWLRRKIYASRANRELARQKGVLLPERNK